MGLVRHRIVHLHNVEVCYDSPGRRDKLYLPSEDLLACRVPSPLLYVPSVIVLAYCQGLYHRTLQWCHQIKSMVRTENALMTIPSFLDVCLKGAGSALVALCAVGFPLGRLHCSATNCDALRCYRNGPVSCGFHDWIRPGP